MVGKRMLLWTVVFLMGGGAAPVGAGDSPQQLLARACDGCHAARFGGDANRIYQRSDRKLDSLAKLKRQVEFCNMQVGAQWFDEEVQAVTDHLNHHYYHFTPGQ